MADGFAKGSGQLAALLSGLRRNGLRYAAFGAVGIVVAQTTLLGLWAYYRSDPGPIICVSRTPAASVRFSSQAKLADVTALLDSLQATVISGPTWGRVFEVRLIDENATDDDITQLVTRLKEQPGLVEFAAGRY